MENLELTYAEISRILSENWYDDRFETVYNKVAYPNGGFSAPYHKFKFKDNVTGKTYVLGYLDFDCGVQIPSDVEDWPKGLTVVHESALVQWLTPDEFPARKDCTPEQKADMDLWKAYKAMEKRKKLRPGWSEEEGMREKMEPMKDALVAFMASEEANDMARVRAVLLPLAIEHGFHHKSMWMRLMQFCGHWHEGINCEAP